MEVSRCSDSVLSSLSSGRRGPAWMVTCFVGGRIIGLPLDEGSGPVSTNPSSTRQTTSVALSSECANDSLNEEETLASRRKKKKKSAKELFLDHSQNDKSSHFVWGSSRSLS